MNTELTHNVEKLLDPLSDLTPGQALDLLLGLRRAKVTPAELGQALTSSTAKPSSDARRPDHAPTDDDLCWFGKYKGTPLREVPDDYFQWLWTQRPIKDEYIAAYTKYRIIKAAGSVKTEPPVDPEVGF